MLRNASEALAKTIATGLGMQKLPDALPRALKRPETSEVTVSPLLSLMFRPGERGIDARKVALLVANGVAGASLVAVHSALASHRAVAKLLAPKIGMVKTAVSVMLTADASLENEPRFLSDALVLPDGKKAVDALAKNANTMKFIRNQHQHCKTIFVLGASKELIALEGLPAELGGDDSDPRLIFSADGQN